MKAIALAVFAAAFSCLFAGASTPASAGSDNYYVCWENLTGSTDCADLPYHYKLKGVARPYCNDRDLCTKGQSAFKLTHKNIKQLSKYVKSKTMRPYHLATIYAPREARHHHHHRGHWHHHRHHRDRDCW